MPRPATHLLFQAATGGTVDPGPDTCCLCGLPCSSAGPVSDCLADTFTNHGLCRSPHSLEVCPACNHYFTHRWEVGQKYLSEYRKHSMLVTRDGFVPWQRAAMRADLERFLRDGCPECVLVVGLSKKKHCLPLAVANPPGTAFTVQLEEERVRVCPREWFALAEAFDGLLSLGARKGEILSGGYHHQTLRKASVVRLLELDRRIRPVRPSGLLTLLSYVTLLEDGDDDTGGAAGN